jgi:hypothetical protein
VPEALSRKGRLARVAGRAFLRPAGKLTAKGGLTLSTKAIMVGQWYRGTNEAQNRRNGMKTRPKNPELALTNKK